MRDNIVEMIKNNDLKSALEKMQQLLKNILLDKLKEEKIKLENNDFVSVVECCIKEFPQRYDILTYLRNLYFFSDKTDSEKLYELAYIYEILSNEEEYKN